MFRMILAFVVAVFMFSGDVYAGKKHRDYNRGHYYHGEPYRYRYDFYERRYYPPSYRVRPDYYYRGYGRSGPDFYFRGPNFNFGFGW